MRKKSFVSGLQDKLTELKDAVKMLQDKKELLTHQNTGLRGVLGV
jgi:hypothetical protein